MRSVPKNTLTVAKGSSSSGGESTWVEGRPRISNSPAEVAFSTLYNRHKNFVVRVAVGIVGDNAIALELCAEMSRLCHQLNNPLTSIVGRSQILQMKMKREPDSPYLAGVETIADSAQRLAGYVQEMARAVNEKRDALKARLGEG